MALGDGAAPANPEALTYLISEKRNAPIQSFAVIGNGTSRIRAIVTNVGLAVGFFAREVGVFATDPDTGSEVLYAYANAGTQADYLPAEGGATIVEHLFDLITVVDPAPNVTAVINDSLIYATKDELTGVALEGDTLVFPGSTNSYLITNFSSFSKYSVSSDIGTATVTGDTVTLVIDAGQASGGLNMIVTRDGYQYVFRIAVGESTIAQPVIENPAEGVSNIGSGVTLTTSEFLTYPESADTHASTDWQVATDAGFTAIVFESLADASNLEAIAIPQNTFQPLTTYYARARHNGAGLGPSDYSPTRTFSTKENFYPTNEIGKLVPVSGLSGGYNYGSSVSIYNNYAAIGAPAANSAYIFERSPSGDWGGGQRVFPVSAGSIFGTDVDIDNGRAVIGMPAGQVSGVTVGVAEVFERDGGGVWSHVAVLTSPETVNGDQFGFAVSISGDFAIVGAPNQDAFANNAGAVYIFKRNGSGVWSQTQKLIPSTAAPDADLFGFSVDISGDYIVVGATRDATGGLDAGAIYVFERDVNDVFQEVSYFAGNSSSARLGNSVSIDANRLIAGTLAGYAEVYQRNNVGLWEQVASLSATPPDVTTNTGRAVSISGDYAAIEMTNYDAAGTRLDAVGIFGVDQNGSWFELAKLAPLDVGVDDSFGGGTSKPNAISISGSYLLVGAWADDDFGGNSGMAFIFE